LTQLAQDGPLEEDEGELQEGFRASFPVTFGRQETKHEALENVHSKTKRPGAAAAPKKSKIAFNIGGASIPKVVGTGALPGGGAHPVGVRGREEGAGEDAAAAKRARIESSLGASDGPAERDQSGTGAIFARGTEASGLGQTSSASKEEDAVAGPRLASGGLSDDGGAFPGPSRPPQASVAVEGGELVGPPRPPEEESEDDSDDEDADADPYRIPLEHEITLKGHTRVVAALAVDPTGSRVLTGGFDYMVKMFDFNGMDARLKSFRHLEPSEGHQVRALSWSPTADRFLVVTGSAQAKVIPNRLYVLDFHPHDGRPRSASAQARVNSRLVLTMCNEAKIPFARFFVVTGSAQASATFNYTVWFGTSVIDWGPY
jgi:hypothetical protein